MNKKWIEILTNLLFWASTTWFIICGFSIEAQEIEIKQGIETITTLRSDHLMFKLILCTGLCLFMFYTNIWNISKLSNSQVQAKIIGRSLFLFLLTIGLYFIIEKGLISASVGLPNTLIFGITSFYFTVSITYGLGKTWIKSQQKQQQLLIDKKQVELNLLRNQLQPHFLFNALNNLLSLVDQQQSPQLANSFERLSQLLRYVIDETRSDKVTLAKEIQFIKNYAALQLLRFEIDEVNFDIKIKGNYDNQLIEPGIFIPFVENAFKYGTEPEQKTTIHLVFDITKDHEILFTIKNEIFDSYQQNESTGTGIQSTKERLNLVYPNKHSILISRDNYFYVELKLMAQ